MQIKKPLPVCWIFCTVIDNFGDIGVSWRLAQILSSEQGMRVHLWLDDEAALRTLVPDLPPLPCRHRNIVLRLWQENAPAAGLEGAPPPGLVIEAFGCRLPQNVLDAIRRNRALWLNWEYLSAENWAEAMHGKPSPQTDGMRKFFWLMGFTGRSGGLLREQNYAALIRPDSGDLRKTLMLPPKNAPEWLVFGYESSVWADWLSTWRQSGRPLTLLLAGGRVIRSLRQAAAIPEDVLDCDGAVFQTGPIRLVRIPFLPQNRFDALLRLCDGLIVRGEDSFVRAQFSGKPFFWHIYPQEGNAHIDKLHAFWHKAAASWPEPLKTAHQALSDELNGRTLLSPQERLAHWRTLAGREGLWQALAENWRDFLFAQSTAAERLAAFAAKLPNPSEIS